MKKKGRSLGAGKPGEVKEGGRENTWDYGGKNVCKGGLWPEIEAHSLEGRKDLRRSRSSVRPPQNKWSQGRGGFLTRVSRHRICAKESNRNRASVNMQMDVARFTLCVGVEGPKSVRGAKKVRD